MTSKVVFFSVGFIAVAFVIRSMFLVYALQATCLSVLQTSDAVSMKEISSFIVDQKKVNTNADHNLGGVIFLMVYALLMRLSNIFSAVC